MYMMVMIMMVVVVVMMMMTFIDVSVSTHLRRKIPSGTKPCEGEVIKWTLANYDRQQRFNCKSSFNIFHLSSIIFSLYDNFITSTLVLFRRCQALH